MRNLATVTLMLSTLSAGLMAGLFAAFAYAVMPGLKRSSPGTLIEAMQQINIAILNPVFLTVFMGGFVVMLATAATHLRADLRRTLPWLIVGLVLYVVMFAVTAGVNVPLNEQLAGAGEPFRIAEPAAVREAFEGRWVAWNIVRAVAATGSFICFAWALTVHGASRV